MASHHNVENLASALNLGSRAEPEHYQVEEIFDTENRTSHADDNDEDENDSDYDYEYDDDSDDSDDSDDDDDDDDGLLGEDILKCVRLRKPSHDEMMMEESEICSICRDDLYQEDRTVGVLRCRHEFHQDCIGGWLRMKNLCPLCKAAADLA